MKNITKHHITYLLKQGKFVGWYKDPQKNKPIEPQEAVYQAKYPAKEAAQFDKQPNKTPCKTNDNTN